MSSRFFRLGLLASGLSLLPATLPAQEPTTPAQPSVAPINEELVGPIKLPDAPLDSVLQLLEMWTGRVILRPQALPANNYSLNIPTAVPKSQALLALETLMNMNQIGIAPMGDRFLKVVPLGNVRIESPELIEGSTLGLPPSGRIASKVFTLDFLRVNEFIPQVASLLNPQLGGPLLFDKANAALITDSISTLQRIEVLVRRLDQPATAGFSPRFYSLQFAKASDLVNKLRTILQGPLQNQLGSATTFNADDRTNQVVLMADPRLHAFFDDLVAKLDVRADPNTRNEVIYLKNANAPDVATLVSQLVSGQTQAASRAGGGASVRAGQTAAGQAPAEGAAPEAALPTGIDAPASSEFSSFVTVLADERSNAVVVSGTVDDIRLIRELIDKIDVLLAQVRIEVVIAEVSLSDEDASGISSLGLNVVNGKLVGFNAGAAGLSIAGAATADGPSGFAQFPSRAAGGGSYDLTGIVQLASTPRKNNTTILSVPSITTTHNKEATIFTGQTRPIISSFLTDTTSTTGSFAGRTTLTQQEIGTTLTVKPLIGPDGSVQLEIKQDVSSPGPPVTIDGNSQPIIFKRSTESFVSVQSGEIIVLGGLQQNTAQRSRSRLGPIPIIGDLLGARSSSNDRSELIFFLRPTILTNTPADNDPAFRQMELLPHHESIERALGGDPLFLPEEKPAATPRLGPRR